MTADTLARGNVQRRRIVSMVALSTDVGGSHPARTRDSMKSLRVSLVLTSMLVLSASTLSAQSSKIPCKDGTKAKGGHFSCWGHGGIVTGAVKPAQKTEAKATSKPAKQERAASNAKPVGKKPHSTVAKAHAKKARTQKVHAKKAHTQKVHAKKAHAKQAHAKKASTNGSKQ